MQDRALRLNAEQRDNLVAYLDGELEEDTTQYIDQVLAKSEVARHEVEALARTWELLDLLPKPNATENFTERTLTTLKVSEVRTQMTDQPWFTYVRKGAVAVVWVAVLSVAASVGFVATTRWVPNPNEELLTDLRLMKNLDVYLEADSIDFVNELQRMGSFSPPADSSPTRELGAGILATAPGKSQTAALFDMATKLTESERDLVVRNRELWKKLPVERQIAMRTLHNEMEAAATSKQTTLETYYTWLQTLTLGQRDDLQTAKNVPERIALVLKYKNDQDASRETELFDLNLDLRQMKPVGRPSTLTKADLKVITDILYEGLSTPAKFGVDSGNPLQIEKYAKIIHAAAEQQGGFFGKFPDDETLDRIVEGLSDEPKRKLQSKDTNFPRRFAFRGMLGWGLQSMLNEEMAKFFPTEEQLRDVFVKQSAVERQELTQLNSRDLTRELLKKHWHTLQENPEFKRHWQVQGELQRMFPMEGFMRDRGRGGPPQRPGEGGGFGGFPPRTGRPSEGRGEGPPEPGSREPGRREPDPPLNP